MADDNTVLITPEDVCEQAKHFTPCREKENLPLYGCLGRILAHDLTAAEDEPPFRCSLRDGYAVAAASIQNASPAHAVPLNVIGVNYAGRCQITRLRGSEAVRIMTGAMIPEGADAVVMNEMTDNGRTVVTIRKSVLPGENVEEPGHDFKKGSLLIPKGTFLDAAALSAAASAGRSSLDVLRRLRVCVFPTGDELVPPGSLRREGSLYSSNDVYLTCRLRELGCIPGPGGRLLEDDPDIIAAAIQEAIHDGADMILTSGGMSSGDKDYLPQVIGSLGGQILLRGMPKRPGPRFLLARCGPVPVFSLPGRPRAVRALFESLIRPMIFILQGRHTQSGDSPNQR